MTLTKAQRKTLWNVYKRHAQEGTSYKKFRKTIHYCNDYIMVNCSNMWIGIEKDGYAHT